MRKGMWSAAAIVAILSGSVALWGTTVQAADTRVAIVEGSQNDYKSWKFSPQEITVPVGSTVVWRNEGNLQHDVKAENGSFGSKLLDHGGEYSFQFTAPGVFNYFCSPHKDLGMTGVVRVGDAATPTPAPATPTTQAAASGATTTTTAAKAGAAAASTSTTAKNGTTTTTAGTGVTATTQAPSVTPTSAPDTADETTTTTAAGQSGGESAAAEHGGEGGAEHKKKENSPIGIAFASLSTLLLAAIAGKLLASKA